MHTALYLSSQRLDQEMNAQVKLQAVSADMIRILIATLAGIIMLAQVLLGLGLRGLHEAARGIAVGLLGLNSILGILNLLGKFPAQVSTPDFPVRATSLLLSMYCLVFLVLPSNSTIFTGGYHRVITKTREIRARFGIRDQAILVIYLTIGVADLFIAIRK